VTTDLGSDNFLFFLFLIIITKRTEGLRDLREAHISAKSVEALGRPPRTLPLKPDPAYAVGGTETLHFIFVFTYRHTDITAL
jgi:hypothetical protein